MSLIRCIERNIAGRDFAVGDIHGHFTALQGALDAVAFDPVRDRLFSVGDMVDRGPESEQVLDWLAKPWFFAVQGNHEDIAVRYVWGEVGGGNYLSLGGAVNGINGPHIAPPAGNMGYIPALTLRGQGHVLSNLQGGCDGCESKGWVPLDGSCQIPGWMDVEVRRDDGSVSTGRACELSWDGVVAFRVAAEVSS